MKIIKDLKTASYDGLKEKLGEFKKELLKLNVQVATGANTSSPGRLKQTKKNIARVLMLMAQQESEKK